MSLEKFKHKRREQAFWFQRYKCCVIDLVCIKPGMKRAGAIIRICNTLQRPLYKRFGPQALSHHWEWVGGSIDRWVLVWGLEVIWVMPMKEKMGPWPLFISSFSLVADIAGFPNH